MTDEELLQCYVLATNTREIPFFVRPVRRVTATRIIDSRGGKYTRAKAVVGELLQTIPKSTSWNSPSYRLIDEAGAVIVRNKIAKIKALRVLATAIRDNESAIVAGMDDDTYACLTKIVAFVEGLK